MKELKIRERQLQRHVRGVETLSDEDYKLVTDDIKLIRDELRNTNRSSN